MLRNRLECSGPDGTCQTNSVNLQGLGNNGTGAGKDVAIYNLNTRGVYDLVRLETSSGRVVSAQADNYGSWGGLVAAYLGYQ